MNTIRVKWITGDGGAQSCAVVRGAIPAGLMNASPAWQIEVKGQGSLYPYDSTNADIMVFQRYWDDAVIPTVRNCRNRGIRTVFDVDDALWLLPDPSDRVEGAKFGLNIAKDTIKQMVNFMENEVDAVTCSTEELAFSIRRLCHPRSLYVVPNYIDHRYFYPVDMQKDAEDRKTILWYAALGHNYSAGFLCSVLTELLEKRNLNVEVLLLGCPKLFPAIKSLTSFGNRVQLQPWVSYFNLGLYIANTELVLCPVLDHPFTHCKSEIKAVEAGACGVPMIMSDVPQYRRFADKVLTPEEKALSLLPNDKDAWLTAICSIIENSTKFPHIAKRVNASYGAMRCVEMWAECYHRILTN